MSDDADTDGDRFEEVDIMDELKGCPQKNPAVRWG